MGAINDLLKKLEIPASENRAVPFWAWNDKLESEELKRQIKDMKNQGMGGLFIHSREGLETEYLSEEWMDRVASSVEEAEKENLEIWIYDEDKWPSGSAGGKVSAADRENFTARGLTARIVQINSASVKDLFESGGSRQFLYLINRKNGRHQFLEKGVLPRNIVSNQILEVLILQEEISGTSEWYNGSAPTDNLNPEAIRYFLEITHKAYQDRFSHHFGKTIKGFFTDEPNFCDFFSSFTEGRPWLPWSSVLEDFFVRRRGYSINMILPLLFVHGNGEQKARYDYWLTLTELFSSSYMKPIYHWCSERNLELTGHMLFENDMGYSIRVSGAAMSHYRYFHVPGVDLLAVQREEYLTVKQCTSVANQYGRKSVFTETYGCSGWEMSFAEQKKLGDWQFVMGVNRRCQHLALYSMKGCRKRDYPPSFNYHNSWWPYQSVMEEYFSRLSLCVSTGGVMRKLLVLHPVADCWMDCGSDLSEDLLNMEMNMGWLDDHILSINKKGNRFNKLAKSLLQSQFDFDFGDELILKTEGKIDSGQFRVRNHKYDLVLVPGMRTLMKSSAALLRDFLDCGGKVLWVKPYPVMIDAEFSEIPETLLEHRNSILFENFSELLQKLDIYYLRALRIADEFGKDKSGFLSMIRKTEEGYIVVVINQEENNSGDVIIRLTFTGDVTEYDPWTTQSVPVKVHLRENGEMDFLSRFDSLQSKVFFVKNNSKNLKLSERVKSPDENFIHFEYRHPHTAEPLVYGFPRRTRISLNSDNALILDRCQIRLKGGSWNVEMPVWEAQRKIREQLKMRPVYYNGAPQRYSWLNSAGKEPVLVEMMFSFNVEDIPDDKIFAIVENSKSFDLYCNGTKCELTDEIFLDRQWNRHRIKSIKKGLNKLEIHIPYDEAIELEDIYLVGNFGVSVNRSIIGKPDFLSLGDWCFQGLFHYPGSVTYHYELPAISSEKKLYIKLGSFKGTLAVVKLNGRLIDNAICGDKRIPLNPESLCEELNHLEIEIVGSLRNLLGPFHRKYANCVRISWADFRTEGVQYTSDYAVLPYGLMGECAIVSDIPGKSD